MKRTLSCFDHRLPYAFSTRFNLSQPSCFSPWPGSGNRVSCLDRAWFWLTEAQAFPEGRATSENGCPPSTNDEKSFLCFSEARARQPPTNPSGLNFQVPQWIPRSRAKRSSYRKLYNKRICSAPPGAAPFLSDNLQANEIANSYE